MPSFMHLPTSSLDQQSETTATQLANGIKAFTQKPTNQQHRVSPKLRAHENIR